MQGKTNVSRHMIDSAVSMLIVQLPFPSLPVQALRGTDDNCLREDTCTSHDLLSQAIAVKLLCPCNAGSKQLEQDKIEILQRLLRQVQTIFNADAVSKQTKIEKIYDVFCSEFRAFMQLYPASSLDIRIAPMHSVDKKNTAYVQSRKHLVAMYTTVEGDASVDIPTTCRYEDIIWEYAFFLNSFID